MEIKPHDFRHSFVTMLRARGRAPEDIMTFTGHRDPESLNIYSHASSAGAKQITEETRLFDK